VTDICKLRPPVAKKISHQLEKHRDTRIDNYYWMRDDSRTDLQVLDHLRAENDYCAAMLAPQQPLQQRLFDELKARIVKDDRSLAVKDGQYWYHSEIQGDDEYHCYYRSLQASGLDKQLLLNVNECAKAHQFFELGDFSISPDDRIMSYSEDIDGRRIFSILFKDLDATKDLPDILTQTEGQLMWANDNETVFYVKKDSETLLGNQVYRHILGTKQSQDVLVFEEQDPSFYLSLGKSRDESLLFISLDATQETDTLVLDANDPTGEFLSLIDFEQEHEYQVDKLGQWFYIVTNWQAQNFRLMKATANDIFEREKWQQVIAHRSDVLLESVELFNDYLVVTEREQGQIRFVIHPNEGTPYQLEFDDPCYFACLGDNPEPQSTSVRIYYSSLTTPGSTYQFELASGKRSLLKQQRVIGDFDSSNYTAERLAITGRDGALLPVSLVYRQDLFKQDGTNPLLQYGYGAYGITIDPSFCADTLSLLDRGFVYAIAHVRGSEMLGRGWYDAGKKLNKQNSFNDFIDITQALTAQGYGASDKMFASGASAGGLLMGTVVNQAPQLYLGVGVHVPFLDIVTTMLDESIPLTTNEYDEWGNPNDKLYYDYMLNYSPYDNISAQSYPHLLVTTGLHDSQVQYFEPMKWVAKLRELKTDNNILVFKTDMESGHGGASGRFKSLHEKALEMAFFIKLLADS
jgi:oligopeptidase B